MSDTSTKWQPKRVSLSDQLENQYVALLDTIGENYRDIFSDYLLQQYNIDLSINIVSTKDSVEFESIIKNEEASYFYKLDSKNEVAIIQSASQHMCELLVDAFYGVSSNNRISNTKHTFKLSSFSSLALEEIFKNVNKTLCETKGGIYTESSDISNNPNDTTFSHIVLSVNAIENCYIKIAVPNFLLKNNIRSACELEKSAIQYDNISVSFNVILDTETISLGFINDMTEGKLIPISHSKSVVVKKDQATIFKGQLGQLGNKKSVKVTLT